MSRRERLAALNGHSLVFECFGCGGIHRVDKAVARIGTSANLISAAGAVRLYRTKYPELRAETFKIIFRGVDHGN
jgi:hypothetical protein